MCRVLLTGTSFEGMGEVVGALGKEAKRRAGDEGTSRLAVYFMLYIGCLHCSARRQATSGSSAAMRQRVAIGFPRKLAASTKTLDSLVMTGRRHPRHPPQRGAHERSEIHQHSRMLGCSVQTSCACMPILYAHPHDSPQGLPPRKRGTICLAQASVVSVGCPGVERVTS